MLENVVNGYNRSRVVSQVGGRDLSAMHFLQAIVLI